MAILRNSLLGLTAICLTQGGAFAQQDVLIKKAFNLVMVGKKAEALAPLQEVLKSNPSSAEAFELWKKIEADVWHELVLTEGDVGAIARSILTSAQAGRKELSRDADTINGLVAAACQKDYGPRRAAILKLKADHGQYAVPALLEKVGDHDDEYGSICAMQAVEELGFGATLPLVEALASKNPTLRRNIAGILNLTRDHRAIPALTALLKDENEGVIVVAKEALNRMGANTGADPVALYLQQAQDFMIGIGTQGTDLSDVVWSFADGKLSYKDCDPAVYTFELAKKNAEKALAFDPASTQAAILVARSYLAQTAAIKNAKIEGIDAGRLDMAAVAMGPDVLNAALLESMRDKQPFVAVAAIDALSRSLDRDAIGGSALMAALDSTNSMVAYNAALAISAASRASAVPQADKVVAVLARGVSEQALTRVASVGFGGQNLEAIKGLPNDKAGVVVEANCSTIHDLMGRILNGSIAPDVVIVNDKLSDGIPMTIVNLLEKYERTKEIKILIPGEGDLYSGKGQVKVVEAALKTEDLRKEVIESVSGIVDQTKQRAAKIAADASSALYHLAANRVDISGVVDTIAAELSREDPVAIPVAQAIGEGGSDISSLVTAIGGDGSVELKVACAKAAGKILGRTKAISAAQFAALKAVAASAEADAGLRTAVAVALGKASLSPAQRLELSQALTFAAVSVSGG